MNVKLWIIAVVVVVAVVAMWMMSNSLSSGIEVEAAAARVGEIREFVDERGKTRLPKTYLITMPYGGRIEPITVEEDDPVAEGDVVARINNEDLELALAQADADLQQAEAALGENRYDAIEKTAAEQAEDFVESMKAIVSAGLEQVRSSKAALVYAEKDLARVRELRPSGARTEGDLDEAIREKSQSDAGYRQSLFTHAATKAMDAATARMPAMIAQYIEKKKLTGKVLEAQKNRADVLLKMAELDQKRGAMTSPVDGVVLKRHVTNQRELTAGTVLLEIGQPEDLEVEADILSLDMGNVKKGQPVEIHGPAIGTPPARGTVTRIYPAGFTKVSSLGVEQQRVKVIVRLDEKDLARLLKDRNLGVGYRVRVRIFTDKKDEALVVPRSALFRCPKGNWQLYAIRGGNATLQDVEVGLMNDDAVEITKGLKSGEQVILAPETNLENGAKVSPR